MPNLIERLQCLPAATISDVQRNLQAVYAMDPAIHCLVPGIRLAGIAFTVEARSGSIITVHKALLEAPPGSVLVVGGETFQGSNGALFGKLMATQASLLDIRGVVVDGPVRDVADLRELRFPTFARGTSPHVGNNRTVGKTQTPVAVGGLVVQPGDYILGDDDGVAVIPAVLAEQVIAAAEEKVIKEAELVAHMHAGEHLTAMIGFRELIMGQK